MTTEFEAAVLAIPTTFTLSTTPALTGESAMAARVVEEITGKVLDIQRNTETAGQTRQVEVDIRHYALSAASIDAVLKAFREKGYSATYGARKRNGPVYIRVSW